MCHHHWRRPRKYKGICQVMAADGSDGLSRLPTHGSPGPPVQICSSTVVRWLTTCCRTDLDCRSTPGPNRPATPHFAPHGTHVLPSVSEVSDRHVKGNPGSQEGLCGAVMLVNMTLQFVGRQARRLALHGCGGKGGVVHTLPQQRGHTAVQRSCRRFDRCAVRCADLRS